MCAQSFTVPVRWKSPRRQLALPVLLAAFSCGLAFFADASCLEMTRVTPPYYAPGDVVVVELVLQENCAETLTSLGIEEIVPDGWRFVEGEALAGAPPVQWPAANDTGLVEFFWIAVPAFPVVLQYAVRAPEAATHDAVFLGHAIFSEGMNEQTFSPVVETVIAVEPEGETEPEGEGETEENGTEDDGPGPEDPGDADGEVSDETDEPGDDTAGLDEEAEGEEEAAPDDEADEEPTTEENGGEEGDDLTDDNDTPVSDDEEDEGDAPMHEGEEDNGADEIEPDSGQSETDDTHGSDEPAPDATPEDNGVDEGDAEEDDAADVRAGCCNRQDQRNINARRRVNDAVGDGIVFAGGIFILILPSFVRKR